jgi:tetratricopeptide (TPR) repeat protein
MGQTSRWGAALAAAVVAAGCVSHSGVDPETELPVGPTEVGVLYGLDVVSSWTLLEAESLGEIGSLAVEAGRVRVVGNGAALTAAASGAERATVSFQDPGDWTTSVDLEPVDVPAGGPVRYATRGGNWHPVGTFDREGRILWRSAGGVDRLAFGDIEGDGALDLVVGWNGAGGLQRLDAAGEEIWRVRERNVWNVELADLDRDGVAEILHSRADGQLVVRKADGTLREARPLAEPIAGFALEEKREPDDGTFVVYARRQGIHRIDLARGTDTVFPTIHPVFAADVAAARVRLRPEGPELHAFLASFGAAERSFLALYDGSGALVHETVLPSACGALALDRSDPEGDVLAVGCQGRVVLFGREIPLFRRALAARVALVGPDARSVAEEHRELALAYSANGRFAEAEPHAWRSVELIEKASGENAPDSAEAQAVLGRVLAARGDRAAAEIRLRRGLALATPDGAPDHDMLWSIHSELGAFYEIGGQLAKAADHDRQALAALPDLDRRTSRIRADIAHRHAEVLLALGRQAEASLAIDVAIEHHTFAFGAEHAEVQSDRALAEQIRAAASASPASLAPSE